MDLSGIQEIILKEYTLSKGLLFENHLYGCFTLLEKRLDMSACVLDCSFNRIGLTHGFLKDERAIYTGSQNYQTLWNTLLVSQPDISDAYVDALEDCVFDSMKDVSATYFVAVLDSGELPEELLKGIEEQLVIKRRRLPKTRSKRTSTPLQKHKGLSKTRRSTCHTYDKSPVAPVNTTP